MTRTPSTLTADLEALRDIASEFLLADDETPLGLTATAIRMRANRATRYATAITAAAKAVNDNNVEASAAALIEQVAPYLLVTVINEAYRDIVFDADTLAAYSDVFREEG